MKRSTILLLIVALLGLAQRGRAQELPFSFQASSFFAVQVANAESAADWYARTFKLELVTAIDNEDRGFLIRILSDARLTVEIIESRDTEVPPVRHKGLFKAGVYVTDIEAAHKWVLKNDVDADPMVFTDAGLRARSFVLRDPEGNRIQFLEKCQQPC